MRYKERKGEKNRKPTKTRTNTIIKKQERKKEREEDGGKTNRNEIIK